MIAGLSMLRKSRKCTVEKLDTMVAGDGIMGRVITMGVVEKEERV